MHIAIIEDEIGITNFLKQGLEEEGYNVTIAHNGEDGLSMVLEKCPDLVLLDWMLPQMQGIDVCRLIRQADQSTPILFLTAKDTINETIEGLQAGANDYIKKPFSFAELLARIEVHFREKEVLKNQLKLGNILLNKSTYQVIKSGEEIPLTQREFELLEFLIANKGEVCSRQLIIEKIWNIDFDYNTGVIDVFINAIRKKLSMDKDEGYIKTIRGVGYITIKN